jgi:hypothetical protein
LGDFSIEVLENISTSSTLTFKLITLPEEKRCRSLVGSLQCCGAGAARNRIILLAVAGAGQNITFFEFCPT